MAGNNTLLWGVGMGNRGAEAMLMTVIRGNQEI